MKELKLNGLKSHDYHKLTQHLLPIVIRFMLPKHVKYVITELYFFLKAICAKAIDVCQD